MSKTAIASQRGEGISMPTTLPEPQESGNPPCVSAPSFRNTLGGVVSDRAILPLSEASDAMDRLATLCAVIIKECDGKSLSTIKHIAEIAKSVADDYSNRLDCERESLERDLLPRLLAALPEGGEA